MRGKSRITVFISMARGSGCSKSRLAKATGAEIAVQQRTEKWHAAVARSSCVGQNGQTEGFGPLLEVQISKNAMRLWREARLQVKTLKT